MLISTFEQDERCGRLSRTFKLSCVAASFVHAKQNSGGWGQGDSLPFYNGTKYICGDQGQHALVHHAMQQETWAQGTQLQ